MSFATAIGNTQIFGSQGFLSRVFEFGSPSVAGPLPSTGGSNAETISNLAGGLRTVSGLVAERNQASQRSALSARNADILRRNAEISRQQAQIRAKDSREEAQRRASIASSRFGASGVVSGTGSALLRQAEEIVQGEIRAGRELTAGRLESYDFLTRAGASGFESSLFKQRQKSFGQDALLTGVTKIGEEFF